MMESIDPSDPCSAYLIKYNQNSMLLCSILVDSMIGWCVVLCYNLSGKFTENTWKIHCYGDMERMHFKNISAQSEHIFPHVCENCTLLKF